VQSNGFHSGTGGVLIEFRRGLLRLCVQGFALMLSALLYSNAYAADLNSIPEVADFRGRNDPSTPSDQWKRNIDRSLDDVVATVKNRNDVTTDLAVPGESPREHATGAIGDPAYGTKIGEILRADNLPENLRDTNPYAALTAKSEDVLRKKILAAPRGSLTPAQVMDMALDASGGNYPIATLTAHSVLKSAAIRGREVVERMRTRVAALDKGTISQAEYDRQMADLRKQLAPHSDIAARLQPLRAEPTANADKLGPWYHPFGVMALGSVHGGSDALGGVAWEHGARWSGWFGKGKLDPEEATIDTKIAWRTFDPTQLGGYERDWFIEGPHPEAFVSDYTDKRRQARCVSAGKRADEVISQMQGSVQPAFISAARTELGKIKGRIEECPGLGGKIAEAESAATAAADQWLQGARSAANSCDSEFIRKTARDTSLLADDANSSEIAEDLIEVAQTVDDAQDKIETELGLYAAHRDAGNFGLARKALLDAKAAMAPLASSGCFAGDQARIDELIAQIDEREKTICEGLSAKMDEASAHYKRQGGFEDAKKAVTQVQDELDTLDSSFCPAVRTRVSAALDRVKNMGKTLVAIDKALTECVPADLARWTERLSKVSHPELVALQERVKASIAVADNYQRAKDVYAADPSKAKDYFEEARRLAKEAGKQTCTNIVSRIDNNLTRISKVEDLDKWVSDVAKTCNVPQIKQERDKIAGEAKLRFQYEMVEELDTAAATCQAAADEASEAKEAKEASGREAVCRKDYGPGYSVGHILEDGRFFCVPDKVTADAWCVKNNGGGHYAANIDTRGGFACLPTKQTANDRCVQNNGSGWYAGKISADGSYSCHMGKTARNASCRNQYGGGWYAGKVRRDGTFLCHGPAQAQPRPRNTAPRGPSNAEIGAAVGAAIIQGIIQSQQGGGGGGGGGGRRCHRNPNTGQLHCGSN